MSGDAHLDELVGAALVPRTTCERDDALLAVAIELAEQGRYCARPNPLVGAVLAAADGTALSVGAHLRCGGPHAERACLDSLSGDVPADATLYVSLEPCGVTGRTPPCAELLVERGVRRVVFASCDSDPRTSGRGPSRLRAAGVEVLRGSIEAEHRALQQNAGFHSVHLRGRPYVTAKWAMTPTGRFATGDPSRRWISSEASRRDVHDLRARSGAVMTGIGTVLADDPLLTVRGKPATRVLEPPLRVVMDRTLRLPLRSQLVRSAAAAPVLVIAAHDAPVARIESLRAAGVDVWCAPPDGVGAPCLLGAGLALLGARGVNDVLLEAGPTLLDAAWTAGLIDRAVMYVGTVEASPDEPGLNDEHPLVAQLTATLPTDSGGDRRYDIGLVPAWRLPGATCD